MKLTGKTLVYFPPVGVDAFPFNPGTKSTSLVDWILTMDSGDNGPGYPAEVYTDPDEVPPAVRWEELRREAAKALEQFTSDRLEAAVAHLRAMARGDRAANG